MSGIGAIINEAENAAIAEHNKVSLTKYAFVDLQGRRWHPIIKGAMIRPSCAECVWSVEGIRHVRSKPCPYHALDDELSALRFTR